MKRRITLAFGILALWLLLSGHYTGLLVALGVLSTLTIVMISRRMTFAADDAFPPGLAIRFVTYLPWLIKEVFVANVAVARLVLSPRLSLRPAVVHFHARQRTAVGRVIFANSITLTPGTITTGIDGADLEIHALTATAVDGHEEGDMARRVIRLEGGGPQSDRGYAESRPLPGDRTIGRGR